MLSLSSLACLVLSTWVGGPYPQEEYLFKEKFLMVNQTKDFAGAHNYLLLGGIHRGLNYLKPKDGEIAVDFSRLPTCYHHPQSPIGMVMQRFNWFPAQPNTFWADTRLPASLVGLGATPLSFEMIPAAQLAALHSEPPIAVVGMYIGTMASYARPFQEVHFFESNPSIVELSLPKKGKPYFTFIEDAQQRGANIKVFQGTPRFNLLKKGPANYYKVMVVEICPRERLEDISVDLLTKEGVALLMSKLAQDGILCYDVSNRFINVKPVLVDVANELGLSVRVGYDADPSRHTINEGYHGQFSSEWVMISRKKEILDELKEPPNYKKIDVNNPKGKKLDDYWTTPVPTGKHLWTDQSRHSLKGLMKADPKVYAVKGMVYGVFEELGHQIPWHRLHPKGLYGIMEDAGIQKLFEELSQGFVQLREKNDTTIEELQEGFPKGGN